MALAVVGVVALAKPVTWSPSGVEVNVAVPTGVHRRSSCCCRSRSSAACASSGTRSPSARSRGFRARKDARRVLIVGAGDGGRLLLREIVRNPELGLQPGRLRRRRPAQAAACGSTACKVLGTTDELAADPRRGRARRGADRDPVGARHAARARRRAPAASAASRCARCRRSSSCCVRRRRRRPPGPRGAGRGRARPRAGAHGARPRRRATSRARSCWSPAPAARSARSCAARSRAWRRGG